MAFWRMAGVAPWVSWLYMVMLGFFMDLDRSTDAEVNLCTNSSPWGSDQLIIRITGRIMAIMVRIIVRMN